MCVCAVIPLSHGLYGSLFWITAFPRLLSWSKRWCNTIRPGEKRSLRLGDPENFHFTRMFLWLRCSNCVFQTSWMKFSSSSFEKTKKQQLMSQQIEL